MWLGGCLRAQSLGCVWLFVTPWTVASPNPCQAPLSIGFPGTSCHALLQGLFPPQGLNFISCVSLIAGGFFTNWVTWEALSVRILCFKWRLASVLGYLRNDLTMLFVWQYAVVMASLVTQMVKNMPAMWETQVRSLGQEDPLEECMATHSSLPAWRIPWTEEPSGLQFMESRSLTRLHDQHFHFHVVITIEYNF